MVVSTVMRNVGTQLFHIRSNNNNVNRLTQRQTKPPIASFDIWPRLLPQILANKQKSPFTMITSFFKSKRDRTTIAAAGKENGAKKQKTTTTPASSINEKPKNSLSFEASELIGRLEDPCSAGKSDTTITDNAVGKALPTWRSALDKHFSSASFRRLASFVDAERYVDHPS